VDHPFRDPPTGLPGPKTLRDHARDILFWPDPDIRWTRRAIAAAKAHCPFTPDWILTTSPPESIHAAGKALLAHWPEAKWAIDARDHWLVRPFRTQRRHPARAAIERRMARHMLAPVSVVFAVNDLIRDEYAGHAPHARTVTLPHFVTPPEAAYTFQSDGIHLVHTGSFKLSDPDVLIEPLLSAFEAALERNADLRLHLAGRLRQDEIDAVATSPAANRIEVMGLVPLETAHALQAAADALVVVAAPNAPVPPGKLAEYLAAGRPIIAIGDGPWRNMLDGGTAETDAARLAAAGGYTSAIAAAPFLTSEAMQAVLAVLDPG
jgi:glycosyltransferase involved in cell wall biosynthesis